MNIEFEVEFNDRLIESSWADHQIRLAEEVDSAIRLTQEGGAAAPKVWESRKRVRELRAALRDIRKRVDRLDSLLDVLSVDARYKTP